MPDQEILIDESVDRRRALEDRVLHLEKMATDKESGIMIWHVEQARRNLEAFVKSFLMN